MVGQKSDLMMLRLLVKILDLKVKLLIFMEQYVIVGARSQDIITRLSYSMATGFSVMTTRYIRSQRILFLNAKKKLICSFTN